MKLEIKFDQEQIKNACIEMVKDKFDDTKLEIGQAQIFADADNALTITISAEVKD